MLLSAASDPQDTDGIDSLLEAAESRDGFDFRSSDSGLRRSDGGEGPLKRRRLEQPYELLYSQLRDSESKKFACLRMFTMDPGALLLFLVCHPVFYAPFLLTRTCS
jgi:hypothetical protein